MADKNTLDLARQWAADIDADRATLSQDTIDAAADLISSLPDAWVDADTLRKYIAEWREGLATAPRDEYEDEILDGLEDMLPGPLEPAESVPKGGPIETELDPAYTYRDKDGDTWEFLNHNWRCSDYGRDATNYLTPPAKYGPYTRVEA